MFGRKIKKEQEQKKLQKKGIFAGLVLILTGFIYSLKNFKKLKKLANGEKREIEELTTGKENFNKFFHDSKNLFKNCFIPHEGNDHKPKALRSKALLSYALIAMFVKVGVTGFLFFAYPSSATLSEIIASRMISLANAARAENDLEPLQINQYLIESAIAKGKDMLTREYFNHDTSEGKKPWQWIDRTDYDYVYAGENLAMDFVSAEVVQEAFMKSPSHRRNILNPKYKDIGIAVLHGEMNGERTILLVEFFGTKREDVSTLAMAQTQNNLITAGSTNLNIEQPNQEEIPIAQDNQPSVAGGQVSLEELAAGSANEAIIVVGNRQKSKSFIDLVINYSNIFFIAFLLFILISLLLNILIKVRVQHSSVILQSVAVAALLLALILFKFHFVEQIAPQILIL